MAIVSTKFQQISNNLGEKNLLEKKDQCFFRKELLASHISLFGKLCLCNVLFVHKYVYVYKLFHLSKDMLTCKNTKLTFNLDVSDFSSFFNEKQDLTHYYE